MNGRFWGVALIAAAGLAVAASKPDGGRILKAEGGVTVERGGTTLNAEKGTVLNQGDTVRTSGDGSKAQWWMQDDSLFVLPTNSTLHIDEYAVPHNNDQSSGRSFMSLLKGGMRTVTGFIARNNPSGYKITTPVATMGVRGTDFSAVLCQDDCKQRLQGPAMRKMKLRHFFGMPHLVKVAGGGQTIANGLYIKVDKGTVSMCNSGGCADISFSVAAQAGGGSCGSAAAGQKPGPIKCPPLFGKMGADFDLEFDFNAGDIDIFRDLDRIIPEPPGSRS